MIKKQKESREVKGEVEGYSSQITPFPGKRGSRGMKIEGEWHNIIGAEDFLDRLPKTFRVGSFVRFTEEKNRKGFWDVAEGSLKKISRQECYNQKLEDEAPEPVGEEEEVEEPKAEIEKDRAFNRKSKLHYELDIDSLEIKISGFKSDDEIFAFLKNIKKCQ